VNKDCPGDNYGKSSEVSYITITYNGTLHFIKKRSWLNVVNDLWTFAAIDVVFPSKVPDRPNSRSPRKISACIGTATRVDIDTSTYVQRPETTTNDATALQCDAFAIQRSL